MIGVFCSSDDSYAQRIIDYLIFYNCQYEIFHLDEIDSLKCEIEFSESKVEVILILKNGSLLRLGDFAYFIIRSGKIKIKKVRLNQLNFDEKVANFYFDLEKHSLIDFIYDEISKKAIGFLNERPLNKLIQLREAANVGLKIPYSLITSKKTSVLEKFKTRVVFTKAIQENIGLQDDSQICFQRVTQIDANSLPSVFFPSLFQEKIEKKIEIRTFFLENRFFSIGYYSLNQTVDSRDHYDEMLYFKLLLPDEVSIKIKNLMEKLNLICGSIDLIYTEKGEFVFLEINTQGQYDWVSKFGGYNLDKVIAKFLIKKANEARN